MWNRKPALLVIIHAGYKLWQAPSNCRARACKILWFYTQNIVSEKSTITPFDTHEISDQMLKLVQS